MENRFVIALLVDNKSGVLTRISSMFTRRGFNIDSLTVGRTEDPRFSRVTICAQGDDATRKQIMKQARKLYNVHEVKPMPEEDSVRRELALIKLRNKQETRSDILSAVDIFRGKIIDFSPNTLCVEITGNTSKIEAFITVVKPLGILEMCRTGITSLERGCKYLNSETQTFEDSQKCKE